MKRLCLIIVVATISHLVAMSQSFDKMWKDVENAQKQDLPKTALQTIDKIILKAKESNNTAEHIKGYVARLHTARNISSDSATALIPRIDSIASRQQNAINRSLWHMVLGWLYSNQNSRLYPDGQDKAIRAFNIATSEPATLAAVKSKAFLPILDYGADSRYYAHDMLSVVFPFVASTLHNIKSAQADSLCAEVMGREIAWYQSHNNRSATLLAKIDSAKILDRQNTNFYKSLLSDYADLSLVTEASLWLTRWYGDKEAYSFVKQTLAQYPNTAQTPALRNKLAQITQPSLYFAGRDDVVYPGRNIAIYLRHRNMQHATVSYKRLPHKGNAQSLSSLHKKDLVRLAQNTQYSQSLTLKNGEPYEWLNDTVSISFPESGVYVVRLTSPEADDTYRLVYVSSLAVMQLPLPQKQTKICVVDKLTGKAVPFANIELRATNRDGASWQSYPTDANGEVTISSPKTYTQIYASTSSDYAMEPIGFERSYDYNWNPVERNTTARLYTDRAVYRPGQTVKMGGFLFYKDNDSTSVVANSPITLELHDVNNKLIETALVKTDALGAFGTDFSLPKECLNGRFSIRCEYGSQYFNVEEYKRPKFRVLLHEPATAYTLGDTIALKGEVKTYSGLPLANTTVFCNVVRKQSWWFISNDSEAPLTVRDTIQTDADGMFTLPVALSSSDNNTFTRYRLFYTYNVKAKATADDGETEEASLNLYAGNVKAVVDLDLPSTLCREQMPTLVATQKNCMGNNVEGRGLYSLIHIVGDARCDTIQTGYIAFNQKGQFDFLGTLPSGAYRLTIAPTDDADPFHRYSKDFTILSFYDTKPFGKEPLQIWQSNESFSHDKPTRILVSTPLNDAWLHCDLVANDRVVDSRVIHVADTVIPFDYTYSSDYGNGLHAQFAIYHNGRLYTESAIIKKPLPDKTLQIRWTTFRDYLQPGAEEKWVMQVLKNEKPVEASVLATMYDASLDKFGKHRLPFSLSYNRTIPTQNWSVSYLHTLNLDIHKPLKPLTEKTLAFSRPSAVLFEYSSARFNRLYMADMVLCEAAAPMHAKSANARNLMVESKGFDSMLQSEEETEDLTDQVDLRTDFNETAFFASSLRTDANGEARIEFRLPESITSWNFKALAHTAGVDYAFADTIVEVQKPFMVQANMPRFLRSGDKTSLSVNITNNTDMPQSGKAQLSLIDAQSNRKISLTTRPFSLKAGESAVVDFPIEATLETPLLICKYVGISKDFSDGEQQYLPVLADMQETMTSVPFTLTDTETHTISLADLDFNPKAKHSTLTVEYTGSPVWTTLDALPSTINYRTHCSTSLAINYSALSIVRHIMSQNPQLKAMVQEWTNNPNDSTPLLALENNQELKQFLLDETPWVYEANNARQRLTQLLQDDATLTLKQQSMLDKLKELQTPEGGWTWYPGMLANTWLTVDIAEMLVRTRNICPATSDQLTPLINQAVAYLDKEAEYYVAQMKKDKEKSIPTLWMRYLYITSMGQWQQTSARKYLLKHLAESATQYDLYNKSMAAVILKATNHSSEAQATLKSIMEYTVSTPQMGRYFDGRKAPLSWSMYRIPTQVAAIEAISRIAPQEKEALAQMKIWLLQSKHTQDWSSPLTATLAIHSLLSGNMLSAPTALPAKMMLSTSKGKPIDINNVGTPNPMVQIGYVKYQTPTSQLAGTLKQLTVQQSAATIEQPLSYGAVYLKSYLPASEIKAAGSELKLTMQMYKEVADGWQPIENNTTLHKGDRVKVRYDIDAQRDFDFVGLKDGRAACMEPVATHSGYRGGFYCEVEDASTSWFVDKLRKGHHVIEALYNIDRTGRFTTASPQIQCQYAPEFMARTHNITLNIE